MEQWFHCQKTDSTDGVREGIVRRTRGDTEYSPNIHQNSPTGCIHDIRGIEPLVQDMLPEQLVSSSVIQSRGAVRNTLLTKALILQNQSRTLRKPAHYDVRVMERPVPALRRGEVLVKINAAGFNHREVRAGHSLPSCWTSFRLAGVAINPAFASL